MGVESIVLIVVYVFVSMSHLRITGKMDASGGAIVSASVMCSFVLATILYISLEGAVESGRIPQFLLVLLLAVVFFGSVLGLCYIAERSRSDK